MVGAIAGGSDPLTWPLAFLLAPQLEQAQFFSGAIGPAELRRFLQLPGCGA